METARDSSNSEEKPRPHAVPGETEGAPKTARSVWVVVGLICSVALGASLYVSSNDKAEGAKAESKPKAARAVQAEPARAQSLPLVAEYRGELDSEIAELASQGSGRLLDVKVNLGDKFKKGDLLAKVDAAETRRLLSEARAQVESATADRARATAELEAARTEASRGDKLLAEQILSEQELTALKSKVKIFEAQVSAAEAQRSAAGSRVALYAEQLSQAELRAPFDGAVAKRHLDPGATVAPGTQVLRLVKSGPLEIRFRASELHVNRLKPDTVLRVKTLGGGEQAFPGHLSRVAAEINRTDRTVEAEGVLEEEHAELRPGMYATVEASLGTLENATVVPSAALLSKILPDGSAERGVYIIPGNVAHYRKVVVMGEHDGLAAVEGVDVGDQVVVQGQELLSEGAAVKIVEQKKKP